MEELISVIIPVYNTEDYLERCIDSIINQTYKNMEIILVDDGSTDRSGKICDAYKERDKRVKVIHKNNSGPSVARNCGIDIATGNYIGFVDSDDFVDSKMYENLYLCMEDGVDLTCCASVSLYKHKKTMVAKAKERCAFKTEEALFELLKGGLITFSVCDKLFRRQLLKYVRFKSGRLCEDVPFTYQLIKASNSVVNIGKTGYFYSCYRENSRSKAAFTYRRVDYVFFTRDIYKDINKNYPQLIQIAEYRYFLSMHYIINQINNLPDRSAYVIISERLKKALRRMLVRILRNPFMNNDLKGCFIKNIID